MATKKQQSVVGVKTGETVPAGAVYLRSEVVDGTMTHYFLVKK